MDHTVHRHRRGLHPGRSPRTEPKGIKATLWSCNVNGLSTTHIKEILVQAKMANISIVLLQSTMYRGHGAAQDQGYSLWYSDCTGRKEDGVIVALNNSWTPRGSCMTRTEILEGRILGVRIRGPRLDLTVISVYAPMDAPNGEARDREEFWEALNNYLCHLPRSPPPFSGGTSMPDLDSGPLQGTWVTLGSRSGTKDLRTSWTRRTELSSASFWKGTGSVPL